MLASMLIGTFLSLLIFVLLVWGLVYILRRWVHVLTAKLFGYGAATYIAYTVVRGWIICSREPEFIAAPRGTNGDGRFEHACDSAGGIIDYLYIGFIGPITVFLLLVVTFRTTKAQRILTT